MTDSALLLALSILGLALLLAAAAIHAVSSIPSCRRAHGLGGDLLRRMGRVRRSARQPLRHLNAPSTLAFAAPLIVSARELGHCSLPSQAAAGERSRFPSIATARIRAR